MTTTEIRAEFFRLADEFGLGNKQLGAIFDRKPQTISGYRSGRDPVPELLLYKMRELAAAIRAIK